MFGRCAKARIGNDQATTHHAQYNQGHHRQLRARAEGQIFHREGFKTLEKAHNQTFCMIYAASPLKTCAISYQIDSCQLHYWFQSVTLARSQPNRAVQTYDFPVEHVVLNDVSGQFGVVQWRAQT